MTAPVLAELVTATAADGARLAGLWTPAADPAAGPLGIDAVITHHGVGGNFYSTSIFNHAAAVLPGLGVAVLRANNRGHDVISRATVGQTRTFIGATYERMADAALDLRAWVDVAAARGARRIALWGHSLGAVKAVLYAADEDDDRVVRVIATSPPRFSHSVYQKSDSAAVFDASYREALAAVEAGEPQRLLHITKPTPLVMSAATFLDKYGPDEHCNYLPRLADARVPVLVTLGRKELAPPAEGGMGPAFLGVEDELARLAETLPRLTVAVVEGADHGYTAREAALEETVRGWLAAIL